MKSSKKLGIVPRIDTNKPQLIEHLRDGYVLLTVPNTNPNEDAELNGVVMHSETEGVKVGTVVVVGTTSAYNLYNGEITISNQ